MLTWRTKLSLAVRPGRACVALAALALAACGSDQPAWSPPAGPVATAQGVIPVPIGPGPRFVPPARAPAADCTPGPVQGRFRAHVELFANRSAIVIPAGIGLDEPRENDLGRIVAARCRARLRTLDPSGVLDFDRADLRLSDLFAVWGEPFGSRRLLSFRGPIEIFVDGDRVRGDVPLRDQAQIVVELGGYVPPHRSFLFPPRR